MTMNSLEGHMKEFGLYPNRWWRAIGGVWAAAQLGYSSGSVQSCLGEKKTNGEKGQFESCCNSPVRNDKKAYQVSGEETKEYWANQDILRGSGSQFDGWWRKQTILEQLQERTNLGRNQSCLVWGMLHLKCLSRGVLNI